MCFSQNPIIVGCPRFKDHCEIRCHSNSVTKITNRTYRGSLTFVGCQGDRFLDKSGFMDAVLHRMSRLANKMLHRGQRRKTLKIRALNVTKTKDGIELVYVCDSLRHSRRRVVVALRKLCCNTEVRKSMISCRSLIETMIMYHIV